MSAIGTIFDIKELAVFDGPGIRTTVFLKGCPLRCQWCHNPEGLSCKPQIMKSTNGCAHCGRCEDVCPSPANCTLCGQCVAVCPRGLIRMAGTETTAKALAGKLLRDAAYLKANDGGYTLSGGEPTAQPAFMLKLLKRLEGNHRAVETCGHCLPQVFAQMLQCTELVMMDLKLMDTVRHKEYTGAGNERILANLEQLKGGGLPFLIRIPVIPGVNDDPGNMAQTAAALQGTKALLGVELLPYHVTAGAKYGMVGQTYAPSFDPGAKPMLDINAFTAAGIPAKIL